jgi:hypothetical protein
MATVAAVADEIEVVPCLAAEEPPLVLVLPVAPVPAFATVPRSMSRRSSVSAFSASRRFRGRCGDPYAVAGVVEARAGLDREGADCSLADVARVSSLPLPGGTHLQPLHDPGAGVQVVESLFHDVLVSLPANSK